MEEERGEWNSPAMWKQTSLAAMKKIFQSSFGN